MSWYTQIIKNGLNIAPSLGSLDATGANETLKVTTPSALTPALLGGQKVSALQPQNEVWAPLGIFYTVTTGITVNAAKVTLRKNGVSAATGGVATLPIVALATTVLFAPFTAWTFAAAPAAADQWSVLVTTTSTAGVVNPVLLAYVTVGYTGITDGIAM
jgi:hypothetical protein